MSDVDPRWKMAMDAVAVASNVLTPNLDLYAALVTQEQQMHSVLHITDPTLYRKAIASKSLQQQVKLCRAAMAFVHAVAEVKAEIKEGAL